MTSRPRALRVSLALAGALAFALAPWAASVASATTPGCRVVDVRSAARHSRLQWAVNRARAGDTLRVYGTCLGTTTIPKNLTIVGVRSTHFGRPILDGQRAGSVVTVAQDVTVTIRSLTITNGLGTSGGGITNHGSLTLVRDVIRDNGRGGVWDGQAHSLDPLATLTILDSTISHNTGVGVLVWSQGRVMLIRSTIIGNNGGGISVFDGGVTLRDTIVTANTTTGDGGGIYATHAEPVELDGASSVDHNSATSGGGILVSESQPLILNGTSSVHDNSATGDSAVYEGGGGIYLAEADVVLNDSASVHDNRAAQGGGVFFWIVGHITLNGAASVQDNVPDDIVRKP